MSRSNGKRSDRNVEPSLLVVETVTSKVSAPEIFEAQVFIGGYPVRVRLDFSRAVKSRFVIVVELPWLLESHIPSKNAVVDFVARVRAGEIVSLPADLSDLIRNADEPFPYLPMSQKRLKELDQSASSVAFEGKDFHSEGQNPAKFKFAAR